MVDFVLDESDFSRIVLAGAIFISLAIEPEPAHNSGVIVSETLDLPVFRIAPYDLCATRIELVKHIFGKLELAGLFF